MGTTSDKLNKLLATKAAIKAAIIEKGQSVSDSDTFASYEDKIRNIQTGPKLVGITITKQPTKTEYNVSEIFDPTGMEAKAMFSNDAYKFISDFTFEPAGALQDSDTNVKVKYTEFGVTAETEVEISIKYDWAQILKDFIYTENEDGTATITDWKGTLDGVASTEIVIPNISKVIL